MRGASDPRQSELKPERRRFCLTNMSITSQIGCAAGLSAILWLCILAVL